MKKQKTIKQIQAEINDVFLGTFSRTPLRQRIEDISGEATELCRYTDLANLKEEAGDLLASTLQLCNENEWDANELIQATLNKIARRHLQYRSLGRKLNVALLCGAFNPITNGHIKLAQFVLNTSSKFDEVWLCPCYSHLFGKKMESPEDRLEMCKIASQVDGRIKIFDYEIKNKLSGETYHFVKRLLEEQFAKDEFDFSYIIGLDNANIFDKWVNYQDLERIMKFVVVSRKGIARNEKINWYLKHPHMYLNDEAGTIPEVSSTLVRDLLVRYYTPNIHPEARIDIRDELEKHIDKNVFGYILGKQLYKERK